MKTRNIMLSLILVMAVITPFSAVHAESGGVDDLRGRWDVEWFFDGDENNPQPPLILYINDMVEAPFIAQNAYLAGGCMRSPDTDAFMPLSMLAFYNPDSATYDVSIYSTVVPPEEWQPFVIRFQGTAEINGKGVPDDAAIGEITTEFGSGIWTGLHHDRRRTKCPSVGGFDLGVQADVYAHKDLAYSTPKHYSLLEAHTVIVSSGLLVEAPDGSTMVVQEYTDIFSPDVDFIGRFRYLNHFEGAPISGGVYNFVLLDVFGNPIPGTESTDVWTGCEQAAPTNLGATYIPSGDVTLSWTAVPDVLGQFEPGIDPQIGFYQIGVSPFNWESEKNYGANGIRSPEHLIPWGTFDPGQDGYPNGWDYGWSLSELDNGIYQVHSEAFGEPLPGSGGFGHECSVYNSAEQLLMHKQGNDLSFEKLATISGRVTDLNGIGLAGVDVGACDYFDEENGFCGGSRSDENGYYAIALPEGTYRVGAYPESGYSHEFYYETPDWNEATPVQVSYTNPGVDKDFTLAPAGSISGTVLTGTDPVIGIWVDACHESVSEEMWGQSPLCTGAETGENGFYAINGLLPGNYRIVIWGDGGYVAEFYNDVPFYDDATLVEVIAGQVADNKDFNLAVAGSISGTVFDLEGNPQGGIGVDAEEGGYGTCTGENGFYTLEGIPLGAQINIAAGRDFCGEHPFEEQVQFDVMVGSTDVNFYLNESIQTDYTIIAHPDHEWISSRGWTVGDLITMYIDNNADPTDGYHLMLSQTAMPADWDPNIGQVGFDSWEPFDLTPDMFVIITDSSIIETLQVDAFSVDQLDESADWVAGTAPPEREVGVGVHQPDGDFWLVVMSDINGNWLADFAIEGIDVLNVFDIHAMIWDLDGDATQANYNFPP